jgi:hypothetical protein
MEYKRYECPVKTKNVKENNLLGEGIYSDSPRNKL